MRSILALAALLAVATPASARDREPILDMHLHALDPAEEGPTHQGMCTPIAQFPAWDQREPYGPAFMRRFTQPPCLNPVWSAMNSAELIGRQRAVMERLNVVGVLSGPPERVAQWRREIPGRFLAGLNFSMPDSYSPETMRALRAGGNLDVIAEVTTQYAGIAPDDPRMEPMWALAEQLDIPVGIHVGTGPPGVIYLGSQGYRARMHSALTMEEVLVRHPRLRVYLMHAGYPMIDDLLALLYAHPQVHVEVGVIVYTQPRAAFYRYLERIFEAGFGSRVMFGSDQMIWPETIERAVRVIEEAPFLSRAQKRDVLFNNGARFLRLTPQQIEGFRALGRGRR